MPDSAAALALRASFHYSLPSEAVKVQQLAIVLGTLSGLRFVAPDLEPPVVVATGVAMQVTYAILCRTLAAQRKRAPRPWLWIGFVGGLFAVGLILALGERDGPAPS